MNPNDYAIIIGLQRYPGLDSGQPPLNGPENDAIAFRDWIVSSDGGQLTNDLTHVQLILSSHYPQPASIFDAMPVVSVVENAFKKLRDLHLANIKSMQGPRIGRRLYIFMAGHGIAPTTYGTVNQHESALLMANAEPWYFGASHHIPGAYTATWFSLNNCFEEIFLFMDCCRESEPVQSLNYFLRAQGTVDTARRCFVFGTRWSRTSRERPMHDEGGVIRGVFTKTLLLGLQGAAAEPDPADSTRGNITVSSLKSFLYQNMKFFIDPKFADETDLQEPDIDYFPKANDGRDIFIKSVPLRLFPVTIRPPVGQSGPASVILYQDNQMTTLAQQPTLQSEWHIQLPRGQYLVQFGANGAIVNKTLQVRGIEGTASITAAEVNL